MSQAPIPFHQPAPPELAQLLLDSLPAAVAIFQLEDPNDPLSLRYIYANETTQVVTGTHPATVIGKLLGELPVPPAALARFRRYAEVATTGIAQDMGEVYRDPDALSQGGWFAIRAIPLPGNCVGLLALTITQRRLAEDKIKQQEQFLEAILENLPNMVFVKDAQELRFVRFNRAGEVLLGHSRELLIGKNDYDFFPADQADAFTAKDREVLHSGKLADVAEEPLQTVLGERWLHTKKAPVLDSAGNPMYLLGISEDITDRRAHEAELRALQRVAEEASRAKSSFMARISHEIRTPMNAVLGLTELVLETGLTAEQREQLEGVHSASLALRSLLNDILDFERTLAGHTEVRPTTVNMRNHLHECLQTFAGLAEAKGLRFVGNVADNVPGVVVLDPLRVRQILANLIGNAIKFTDRGEVVVQVEVKTDDHGATYLHYSVRDTGIGIAAANVQVVFEMFRQVDESTTRAYAGTGLGLSIAKQLVELMDGSIGMASVLGQGSTFWFEIPCMVAVRAESEPHSLDQAVAQVPPGLHVLVVEDNVVNEKLLTQLLNRTGHVVTVARNGRQALCLALDHRFDVVLMDMQMPDVDGYHAIAGVRAEEVVRGGRLPIVALTAHAMGGDRERCLASGADDYVAKPADRKTLFAAIAHALTTGVPVVVGTK